MSSKVPMRRCTGCFQSKPKSELIRIVRLPHTKKIIVDDTGKIDGRGSYICKSKKCLTIAQKSKKIERSIKCKIDNDIYEKLRLYE